MGKPIDGKKLLQDAKTKAKENNTKETNMNKKHIIITIVLTLTFLATLAGMFVLGISYEKGISNRVNNEVKAMVSAIAVEPKAEVKK